MTFPEWARSKAKVLSRWRAKSSRAEKAARCVGKLTPSSLWGWDSAGQKAEAHGSEAWSFVGLWRF